MPERGQQKKKQHRAFIVFQWNGIDNFFVLAFFRFVLLAAENDGFRYIF